MYEHDRSASKGEMSVISPLIIFKHIGTDSDAAQKARQARLGCAPAHKLFELVHIQKKEEVEYPRSYQDYDCSIRLSGVPKGVAVGFMENPFDDISWDKLPDGNDWMQSV